MADELIDIVDENGKVLRTALKSEAHKHGWLHKTVLASLRHGDAWKLVRQAADRQDAGKLVSPVGGHVRAGEDDLAALLRETEEEIGVKNVTHKRIGSARFHRQVIGRDENHLFIVYEIWSDDPVVPGAEVASIETFTEPQLKAELQKNPQEFGGACYFVLEKFYPEFLPPDWKRRWS